MEEIAKVARRPQLVVVDELAHTNAPRSRHPKRFLDVEELLEAGIDVYTTLNIQHVESLNDVAAQITRIRVRETVPDRIIDEADAIELIDLTPEDLIRRLKDGKVYLRKNAERALRHYFSPGNLTALRELALRRTAQRVDQQGRRRTSSSSISACPTWPADLLRRIRQAHEAVPVIVLSSRDDGRGKVEALDQGADVYVTKPFGMNELLARIRTALRHRLQVQGERPVFRTGELTVDLVRRLVRVGEREVKLAPKEYDVLRQLVLHAGKVLTHAHLMRAVWGDATDPQYLRVYVRQLRQKLEPDPERPRYILTETGAGYRLQAE